MKFEPTAGSILFIRPGQGGHVFTHQYCIWLADELSKMLPAGVKAMIIERRDVDIDIVKPTLGEAVPASERNAYLAGWHNAAGEIMQRFKESQ
jgi:hypothetical protein